MNVLVTGGAGYVGSHTAKALARSGHTPITLDNLVRGHKWAVKFGPFFEGNINDPELVKKIIKKHKIEAVMHFAAYAYVGESVNNPKMYFENNVDGTKALLEALRDTTVKKFIFSSTCATYGIPEATPITEETPQEPINPYGETKLLMEIHLADCAEKFGMRSVALRYFNAAGADPELEIGEDHNPETHLIPLVIEANLSGKNPITIMGSDYPTPDGTCVRDYIHVNDLAEAHILALESLKLGSPNFDAYNLGTGTGSSVIDVIAAIDKITGQKTPVQNGKRRPGDPPILVASGVKAKKILGWKPKFDLLRTAQTAVDWHKKHFKR